MTDPDLERLHDDIADREDDTTQREAFEQAVTDDATDEAPEQASRRAGRIGDPNAADQRPTDAGVNPSAGTP
jgi:hypothetical protein